MNTTNTSSIGRNLSEKLLIIALDSASLGNCANDSEELQNCDSLVVQMALYWAALLSPGTVIKARIYTEDNYEDIFHHLSTGLVDLFPFEMSMTELEKDYYWSFPITSTGYHLYSNMNGIRRHMTEAPIKFLTAPFTWGVWICAIASAAFMFFMAPLMLKQSRDATSKNIFLAVTLAFTYMALLYSSHLKALLTIPTTSLPFQDLYDLAGKIQLGNKRIIIEDKRSLRWDLLMNNDTWRPPSVQALFDAVQKRGRNEAIVYQPNVTMVCQLLNSSDEFVYFAYEELVFAACGRLCVWKYPFADYPETPVSLPVSRLSRVLENADLVVHALENYRQLLIRRKHAGSCMPEKMEKEFIAMPSLRGAVLLLIVGYVVGFVILILEKGMKRTWIVKRLEENAMWILPFGRTFWRR